eukprot:7212591-Lingulodinium_polyedra.AAC.1
MKARVKAGKHEIYLKNFFDDGSGPNALPIGAKGCNLLKLAVDLERKKLTEQMDAQNATLVPQTDILGAGKRDEIKKRALEKAREKIAENKKIRTEKDQVSLKA